MVTVVGVLTTAVLWEERIQIPYTSDTAHEKYSQERVQHAESRAAGNRTIAHTRVQKRTNARWHRHTSTRTNAGRGSWHKARAHTAHSDRNVRRLEGGVGGAWGQHPFADARARRGASRRPRGNAGPHARSRGMGGCAQRHSSHTHAHTRKRHRRVRAAAGGVARRVRSHDPQTRGTASRRPHEAQRRRRRAEGAAGGLRLRGRQRPG